MAVMDPETRSSLLADRYEDVREWTERLAAPLSPEDQTVQSMPDVSPTKWHRAHTTWFFETFVLGPRSAGYEAFHPAFGYLFNSYYEAVGARHPRDRPWPASRGPASARWPTTAATSTKSMDRAARAALRRTTLSLVELGLHHEQQHQELLSWTSSTCCPATPCGPPTAASGGGPPGAARTGLRWAEHEGGPSRSATRASGFALRQRVPPAPRPPRRPSRSPTAGDLRRVARVHRGRRIPPARALAVGRLGAP